MTRPEAYIQTVLSGTGHSRLSNSRQDGIFASLQVAFVGMIIKLPSTLVRSTPEDQIFQVEVPVVNLKSASFD